jgi:uncharacterized membrane protein
MMDTWDLLIVAILAVPICAIAALVMAVLARSRLRLLEYRMAGLEARLVGGVEEARAAEVQPEPVMPEPTEPEPAELAEPELLKPKEVAIEAAKAARPPISLEERFGTQWAVWVGGLALALGGFFLVRYSIEQGWFGPAMRVALGALLALTLLAAGEWTRRHEIHTRITGLPFAYIPGVLTAAGTATAYADVYAAYALYGFIGPVIAFLLLGAVALATLAGALLHGPALAGLGLVGAYFTPLIVSTEAPNYWALYLYLAVVTAAAFVLARVRLWRWLAITAVLFSLVWVLPGIDDPSAIAPHIFHLIAGFVLAAALIVSGFLFGPAADPGRIDGISSGALAAYLLGTGLLVVASQHDAGALAAFSLLVAATVAVAWRAESAAAALPAAAIFVAFVFAQWAIGLNIGEFVYGIDQVPEFGGYLYGMHLVLGAGFAVLFGVTGFLAQGRSAQPLPSILWAGSAVFAPMAILAALYYRIAEFDRSVPFATAALLLAALFAYAAELLAQRQTRPGSGSAAAIFATGAVASLALSLSMALEKGWLTVALALMVPGIAWIAKKRPLPALRWLAAAMVMLVLARIAWDPRIVGADLGTRPIFNWLLYGYGIPAASFWVAGNLLRRDRDDVPARIVDAAAILFTVLLVSFEIRHYLTGDPYESSGSLNEIALFVVVGLALAIGLERIRLRSGSVIHSVGAIAIAGLTLLTIVVGLGLTANPLFSSESVGGSLINLILLGYGIPAVLAAVLALVTRGHRPELYSASAAVVAVALAIGYLSLEVRMLYHGPTLSVGLNTDAEQYTYSVVWLAFGVALLAAGVLLHSRPVRFASAAVVMLTVLKVFLIDMSDLTGIYRALSFLGLGIVLMGIGWLYQRLLFARAAPVSGGVESS